MGRYEGMMIASDLDGTFLDAKGRVVRRNIDAIFAFCAEGGLFTFATGRHHDHLPEAVPGVERLVNMPVIVANGSYLYDFSTDRVLAEVFMEVDASRAALQYARANYPRVGFRVSTPQGYLTDGRTGYMQKFIDYSKKHRSYLVEVAPIEHWMQRLWHKIVFQGTCEELDSLYADLKETFGEEAFEYNKSSATLFEIQKKGCSKGSMLRVLKQSCEILTGRPIKVFGVGDYENDLALLQAADVAVCPANAQETVKRVSDMILCSNDEGVIADLIERL
ncbi:MAG: HAD-IIB family hydrolase [Ruminococcaceae bacterium]|nr:HAD-IIB family hydrolase [Oscillospiraceae bacterium]